MPDGLLWFQTKIKNVASILIGEDLTPKILNKKMRIFKIGGIGEKSALCITILIDKLIYPIIFNTVQQSVNILYVHFKKCWSFFHDNLTILIFFFYWTDQFKVFLKQVLNELAFIVSIVNLLAC